MLDRRARVVEARGVEGRSLAAALHDEDGVDFLTAMRLRRWLRLVAERGEASNLLERAEGALWASIRETLAKTSVSRLC